jgi:cell wall-associated NlpC family hydrolase
MSNRSRSLVSVLAVVLVAVVASSVLPLASAGIVKRAGAVPPRPLGNVDGKRPRPERAHLPPAGLRAARIALAEVGVPYVWGGDSPHGFDCSGLVRYAYGRVGISLPHSSYALFSRGTSVSRSHLEPGDLLFFDGLGHVGIYVGGGRMVHAPQTGQSVQVASLSGPYGTSFVAARRVVPY